MGVRWYVAYPLSTRHVEELLEERGVDVDHSTINRWTIKYSPLLEAAFHRRKRPVCAYSTDVCHPIHGKVGSWPIYVNAEEVSQFEWISEPTLTR